MIKFIMHFLKIVLKLLKPLIKMGLFDGVFEDALSGLAEQYSIEF